MHVPQFPFSLPPLGVCFSSAATGWGRSGVNAGAAPPSSFYGRKLVSRHGDACRGAAAGVQGRLGDGDACTTMTSVLRIWA